ncbi:MAG: hypothetical protein Q4F45_01785 [Alistipes sp.]|nr:hypothetical protein [Alistipes sp.]
MKYLRLLSLLLLAVACNKNEVITEQIEDERYRPRTESSAAEAQKVWEYTPAPGQFINELKTSGFTGEELTAEAAVAYAERRMSEGRFVSLGGFGGYIIVGFDHSVDNGGGYDFAVEGNSFDGSSEPGIVWVMQDENGDGKPNDTWYELRGSESGKPSTIQNYAVTYYRPTEPQSAVKWSDSEGAEGEIDYVGAHHSQDYYYPAWITAESYTLIGTRLEARNYDKSGNGTMWVQPAYDWGYADNQSSVDFISRNGAFNLFDIDNAVDTWGNAAEIEYIDFVKVQCGVNAKSGHLGELSTEVFSVVDYKMVF